MLRTVRPGVTVSVTRQKSVQPQSHPLMKKHTFGLLAAAVLAIAATAAFALETREAATASAGDCKGCCTTCSDCDGCDRK